jgi:hypothetical protein
VVSKSAIHHIKRSGTKKAISLGISALIVIALFIIVGFPVY